MSGIIVDIILILGHEARLEGTVIDVGKFGQIGIDQACSGIQGFQASVVITLFLGAYYGFRIIKHLIFVLVGALVALLFNLVRAFSLSMVKINGAGHILDTPIYQFGSWVLPSLHDMVGWIENLLILLTLFFLARLAQGGFILRSMGTTPSNWSNIRFSIPWPFQILTIAWVTFTFFGSELYYSAHEKELRKPTQNLLNINDPELLVEEQSDLESNYCPATFL